LSCGRAKQCFAYSVLRADAKTAPPAIHEQCVANLAKASALSSICLLSGTVLAISSAYL